jgi:glucose-1-phosphate adenylyltransferase
MSEDECAVQPPKFEFYDPMTPIYTSPRFLPPAKLVKCQLSDSIISHGAYLEEAEVEHAIVGLRSRVGKGSKITVRLRICPLLCAVV